MNNVQNLKVARTLAMGAIAVMVAVSIFSVVGMAAPVLSNSGGGSWQYYKDVSIAENSGSTLSAYQVLVQLSGSNFPSNARSDGADIRFTDANGNELSYWIESWDYSGRSAKIWVKVSSIPASVMTTIRMYYGNPSASSSRNGDATFVFFDDFESGTLNKWDGVDSGASVVLDNGNYVLRLYSFGAGTGPWISVQKNIAPMDIRVDLRYKIVQNGDWDGARFGSSLRTDYTYLLADWHFRDIGAPQRQLFDSLSTAAQVNQQISYYSTLGVWYYWGFSTVGSSPVVLKGYGKDGEVLVSYTDTVKLYPSGQLKLWVLDNHATDYVDDVRVRKYASSEPTLTLGAEQPFVPPTTVPPTTVPPTTVPPTTVPPTTVPPTTVPPTTVPPTIVPPTTVQPTITTPAPPKFRVGPSVTLRPVTDVIEENQDGIVELFMNNPSLNDVTLNVDAQVSVPAGLHVSGENFGESAGAGVVAGTFSVPPGKARTISITIKADKSARKGSHTLQFTGLYYPDGNKDAFQPISLTYAVTVERPSKETPTAIPTATPKEEPGFEVILAGIGIISALALRRR